MKPQDFKVQFSLRYPLDIIAFADVIPIASDDDAMHLLSTMDDTQCAELINSIAIKDISAGGLVGFARCVWLMTLILKIHGFAATADAFNVHYGGGP